MDKKFFGLVGRLIDKEKKKQENIFLQKKDVKKPATGKQTPPPPPPVPPPGPPVPPPDPNDNYLHTFSFDYSLAAWNGGVPPIIYMTDAQRVEMNSHLQDKFYQGMVLDRGDLGSFTGTSGWNVMFMWHAPSVSDYALLYKNNRCPGDLTMDTYVRIHLSAYGKANTNPIPAESGKIRFFYSDKDINVTPINVASLIQMVQCSCVLPISNQDWVTGEITPSVNLAYFYPYGFYNTLCGTSNTIATYSPYVSLGRTVKGCSDISDGIFQPYTSLALRVVNNRTSTEGVAPTFSLFYGYQALD